MDKELLKLAVELATAQAKTNALISNGSDSVEMSFVTQREMQDMVMEYYDWLKSKH